MDRLMDRAIDLPINPPPVTEALIGWMFIVDCTPYTPPSARQTDMISYKG